MQPQLSVLVAGLIELRDDRFVVTRAGRLMAIEVGMRLLN